MNEENFFAQTIFFTFPPRLYAVFGFNTNFSVQTEKGTFNLTGVERRNL